MSNSAPARFVSTVPTRNIGVWQGTLTAAEITAGTTIVPPVGGMQFVATDCFMRGQGGTCSGPTTINFQETTTGGVVMSHVSADLTAAAWRYTTAGDGTVVTTKWAIPLVISEGIKCIAVGGSANTAMTTMDYIIMGFYVPATGKHGHALR
jgi:hypothetical protein